jgi:hypothetical protein
VAFVCRLLKPTCGTHTFSSSFNEAGPTLAMPDISTAREENETREGLDRAIENRVQQSIKGRRYTKCQA